MFTFTTDISDFQFRNDDGTEATATYDSTLSQSDYSLAVDTLKRIRLVVAETNGGSANNKGFTWQYQHVEGTNNWTAITTTSGTVKAVSSQLVDDADTTTTMRIGSGTFITDNNAQCEDGITLVPTCDWAGNDEAECELSFEVISTDVADGDTINLRVLIGGVAPNATTNLPTLTVSEITQIDRDVTGITDTVDVVDNNATINRTRDVTGITDTIDVVDNNAVVKKSRNVIGITDTINIVSSAGGTITDYYFDASVAGPTDNDAVWANDSFVFDGSVGNLGSTSTTGTIDTNELRATGSTAPASGDTITQVRMHFWGAAWESGGNTANVEILDSATPLGVTSIAQWTPTWSDYVTLDAPAGGWSYAKLDSIEAVCYGTIASADKRVAKIELEVTSGATGAIVNRARTVIGITDTIDIVDNDATVIREEPRDVVGITDVITVVDNDATVTRDRIITGITDVITIVDNDAVINRARNVIGITDVITITDNDAVVIRTAPRNVVGITDVITITDNDAVVNRARNVTGITDTISVAAGKAFVPTDIPSLITWLDASDRGVTTNQWDDKSGLGNHYTSSIAAEFPVFANGYADFNGSKWLTGPIFICPN